MSASTYGPMKDPPPYRCECEGCKWGLPESPTNCLMSTKRQAIQELWTKTLGELLIRHPSGARVTMTLGFGNEEYAMGYLRYWGIPDTKYPSNSIKLGEDGNFFLRFRLPMDTWPGRHAVGIYAAGLHQLYMEHEAREMVTFGLNARGMASDALRPSCPHGEFDRGLPDRYPYPNDLSSEHQRVLGSTGYTDHLRPIVDRTLGQYVADKFWKWQEPVAAKELADAVSAIRDRNRTDAGSGGAADSAVDCPAPEQEKAVEPALKPGLAAVDHAMKYYAERQRAQQRLEALYKWRDDLYKHLWRDGGKTPDGSDSSSTKAVADRGVITAAGDYYHSDTKDTS